MRRQKTNKNLKIIDFVDFGIFVDTIMVVIGFTYEEAVAEMERLIESGDWEDNRWLVAFKDMFADNGFDDFEGLTYGSTLNHREKGFTYRAHILYLPNSFDYTPQAYTTLAHEVVHLCQFKLRKILDISKEIEAFAYTHSYIMKKILELLK